MPLARSRRDGENVNMRTETNSNPVTTISGLRNSIQSFLTNIPRIRTSLFDGFNKDVLQSRPAIVLYQNGGRCIFDHASGIEHEDRVRQLVQVVGNMRGQNDSDSLFSGQSAEKT